MSAKKKSVTNATKNKAAAKKIACTLDTRDEVQVVVIARMQIDWPEIEITPQTKLGDGGLGMDGDAKGDYFYPAMRRATRDGGCQTRLSPADYADFKTVKDVIDGIWEDLQDKCNLQ